MLVGWVEKNPGDDVSVEEKLSLFSRELLVLLVVFDADFRKQVLFEEIARLGVAEDDRLSLDLDPDSPELALDPYFDDISFRDRCDVLIDTFLRIDLPSQ